MKIMRLPSCLTSKTPLIYKAFYFVFYAGYITFLLYVPVYFKYLGLSAIYVGLLNGIRPLMQTIGAPLWGVIGDRFRIRKIIFIVAFVVMIVKTMVFIVFRPENTLCVVTYYNSSKYVIRNETYVVKHDIHKRWTTNRNLTDFERKSFLSETTDGGVEISKQDRRGLTNTLTSQNPVSDINIQDQPSSERKSLDSGSSLTNQDQSRTLVQHHHNQTVHYNLVFDDQESTRIFFSVLLLVICGDAFDAAVFTLADTSCLDTLGSENYGYYRLWGSAGWGIMSPIIGFTITHLNWDYCGADAGSYYIIFYFYLGLMYLGLLFGSHFEFSYIHNDHVHETVKSALLNFHYGIFLFVTFYAGVCYGFLLYFVNWYIDSLGGTAIVMGTATACKSIMDVLGFFLAGRIIDALGHLNTVTVSLIAYIGAFVSYSYLSEPWYAVPIEVLHAGAYALVWSASVSYLNKAAPAGSSATVQGILQGVYWGLGTGGGTIVGGYVANVFGFKSTFRGFAVVTGVVLAVFLATQLISKYSNLPEEDGNQEAPDYNDKEMFLRPQRSDKKYSEDDDEQWQTPLSVEPAILATKPETPDNSDQPASIEPVTEYAAEDLENIEEQELPERSEDTTKLIDKN